MMDFYAIIMLILHQERKNVGTIFLPSKSVKYSENLKRKLETRVEGPA